MKIVPGGICQTAKMLYSRGFKRRLYVKADPIRDTAVGQTGTSKL